MAFNDRVREGGELFKNENEKILWQTNADAFLQLLDPKNTDSRIMIAELKRNMGKFNECMEIIDGIEGDVEWLKSAFRNECQKENDKVFQFHVR